MEQQERTYEGMIKEWVLTYKTCLNFEDQIKQGMIQEEEIEEYLKEKARLIVCLANLFALKSIEEKGDFELEYIVNELYADVKNSMKEEEVDLTDFDDNYIANMLVEMEKDFLTFETENAEPVQVGLVEVEEEE